MKRLSSQLSEPLLVNWHGGRWVSYPYYGIKTEKCTYKASVTIGCIRRKLVKMTIPRGTMGYRLYAAAANQEARIESRDMRHHYIYIILIYSTYTNTYVYTYAQTYNYI